MRPDAKDANGKPMFTSEAVLNAEVQLQMSNDHMTNGHAKPAVKTAKQAIEEIVTMAHAMGLTGDEMVKAGKRLVSNAETLQQNIKVSTDKIGSAVARLYDTANLDRLERYVALLERSSVALANLAELQRTGALSRIADVINHRA